MKPSAAPKPKPSPPVQRADRWLKYTHTATDSLLLSVALCTLTLLGFMASSGVFIHWFVIPVWLCGIIVGVDAVDWLRGRVSLYDPVGVLGIAGLHFFFFAPLLHVSWNYFMIVPLPPLDWRASLGGMAAFNYFGLLIYRFCRDVFIKRAPTVTPSKWVLNKPKFVAICSVMLVITAILQVWVYAGFGGVMGYIQAATDLENTETTMQGMGFIFLVSETFPILAMTLFAVQARDRKSWQTWPVLALALFTFLVFRIMFGGLRGSRSTILFALLWASGIVHFYLRPIPRHMVLTGVAFMVAFMYIYGFYKAAGPEAIQAVSNAKARAEVASSSGRDFQSVLLGDLSRTDVQAYVFDRFWSPASQTHSDYQLSWGRSYLGGVSMLIPRSFWPGRPINKVIEGTSIVFGMNTYKEGEVWSSRIYGLTGEAMLNFGLPAIPFAFAIFGLGVSLVRRLMLTLTDGDSRLLMYPFLTTFCILLLTADSDNLVFYLVQHGTVPFLVMVASSVVLHRRVAAKPIRKRLAVTA